MRSIGSITLSMTTFDHQPSYALHSRSIIKWITGTGFLVLDGALFFTALIVLIPWNLYSDPGDLWVADPLRKWAFLLAFHTIVVGALVLVRSLLDDTSSQPSKPDRATGWSAAPSAAPLIAHSYEPINYEQTTASAVIAEEWARKWLAETESSVSTRSSSDGENDPTVSWRSWTSAPSTQPREEIVLELEPEPSAQPTKTPGHLEAAARLGSPTARTTDDPLDEDLEWQWIEAAASAWLAKRDHEVSPDNQ